MNNFLRNVAFLALVLCIAYVPLQAQSIHLEWAKNASGLSNYQNTTATVADKDGNVYLSGFFQKPLYFGRDSLLSAIGYMDAFVLKVDPSGKVVWTRQIGYPRSNCQALDVKVDASGQVYLSGMFTATMDFNPGGSGTDTLISVGNWDAFVCKFDASGKYIWSRKFGGAGYNIADYLAIDAKNNVWVSGFFQDLIELNPGAGTDTVRAMGGTSYDRFVCKLDSAGIYQWGLHYQRGSNIGNIEGLALDPAGNGYIVGSFFQTMEFPARHGIPMLTSSSPYDMYLVKIEANGRIAWANRFGGGGDGDFGYDIVADEAYNLYIVGNFNRTADLDPGPGTQNFTCNGGSYYYDIFVLKVDTGGNYIWAKTFGSRSHDNGLAVAVDKAGNVYATGSFQDTVNFVTGSSRPEDNIIAHGGYDIFVVKYDAAGNYVWSTSMGAAGTKPIGGTGPNRGDDIAVDHAGNVFVAGVFKDIVDFDPGANKIELDALNGALFLLKLGCSDTSSSLQDASSCSEYIFNGEVYSSSGTYTQTFSNAAGCDSTVYLSVSIIPLEAPVITINGFTLGAGTGYSSYQWLLNGKIIPGANKDKHLVISNGSYQVIVTNENGCIDTSDVYQVTNYRDASINTVSNLAEQIRAFPNPAIDVVFVNAPVTVNIVVCSIDGKQLLQAGNADRISLSDLAQGLYLLKISDRSGRVLKVEKLIKE